MCFLKRTLAAALWVVVAVPVCAFTFSYGDLLDVKEVKNKDGALQMPLTRKKYKNVKVLSGSLYKFLKECSADCVYSVREKEVEVLELRAAANRTDMWIADLSLNGDISLTFLVFKNKNGFSVKLPEAVQFKDLAFKKHLQEYMKQVAQENI